MKANIAGINSMSLIDSEGIAYVIYMQGCDKACYRCQNHKLQKTYNDIDFLKTDLNVLKKDIKKVIPFIDNIVFQGGEPLLQQEAIIELSKFAKNNHLSVWLYTGRDFETISKDILEVVDVIIDGEYIDNLKGTPKHLYGGSLNQRMFKKEKNKWIEYLGENKK